MFIRKVDFIYKNITYFDNQGFRKNYKIYILNIYYFLLNVIITPIIFQSWLPRKQNIKTIL